MSDDIGSKAYCGLWSQDAYLWRYWSSLAGVLFGRCEPFSSVISKWCHSQISTDWDAWSLFMTPFIGSLHYFGSHALVLSKSSFYFPLQGTRQSRSNILSVFLLDKVVFCRTQIAVWSAFVNEHIKILLQDAAWLSDSSQKKAVAWQIEVNEWMNEWVAFWARRLT